MSSDYIYFPRKNEFAHKSETADKMEIVKPWFTLPR